MASQEYASIESVTAERDSITRGTMPKSGGRVACYNMGYWSKDEGYTREEWDTERERRWNLAFGSPKENN